MSQFIIDEKQFPRIRGQYMYSTQDSESQRQRELIDATSLTVIGGASVN
jgi:hypothetical protein